MTLLMIVSSTLFLISIMTSIGWYQTIGVRNHYKDQLNAAKSKVAELAANEVRARAITESERVPLRTKCRCKHDAFQHDHRGCRVGGLFGWECVCLASRDEVYYTPDPMRPMKRLS